VHLAFINFPILGDSVYGGRKKFAAGTTEVVKKEILKFPRQALHAKKLEFIHPQSGKRVNYSAKTPKDLLHLIELLKNLNE
jgi:23S rRNA pseudouridine1911/1915/1917 synthase